MTKVLVTGVNGFVGKHLVHELRAQDYEVFGVGHSGEASAEIKPLLEAYMAGDLADKDFVATIPLEEMSAIVSLAGLARVGDSFKEAEKYRTVNVAILSHIGERLLTEGLNPRVLAVSTGAVYDPSQPLPLSETSRLVKESSPYVESKLLMEKVAHDLRERGLDCVIVRPFNHAGPGQASGFIVPDLYRKIMQAASNKQPAEGGNLRTKRDYTDVRDIAKAYVNLIAKPKLNFDTYNVCSGVSRSGLSILELLLEETGLTGKVEVMVAELPDRPHDPEELSGSYERLNKETGWQPQIPIKQTIKDFLA